MDECPSGRVSRHEFINATPAGTTQKRNETVMADNKPIWRDEQYQDHVTTYESFMKFAMWSAIGIIVLLILMALFLV